MTPGPRRDASGPLFFVHVMKTGGSTFRTRMKRQLGAEAVFPGEIDASEMLPNVQVAYLAGLSPERLDTIRAFSGHYPFFATELVPAPSAVLTILRDPVDRTISYLKQHHRDRALGPERSLESIYELPWHNELHIHNYQVRVFATTVDDRVENVMQPVDIDGQRMDLAKEHLRQVDILGLQERYDEFVDQAIRRLGWRPDPGVRSQRVSPPEEVPLALRRRIAAENEPDLEFYAFAKALYDERRRRER